MQEVRRLREEKGWGQKELAFHADLSQSVISEIETGKRSPSARTLRKLADALDVEVRDLFPLGQLQLSPDLSSLIEALADRERLLSEDELEELRERASGDPETPDSFEAGHRLFEAITRAYRAAAEDPPAQDPARLASLKMLWYVTMSERITPIVNADASRSAEAPIYPDTRELPLEEAYERVRTIFGYSRVRAS